MPPSAPLSAFERTNFFYGLLLDADRLRNDHAFFNGKRWLLNRLSLGTGVACGLDVRLAAVPPATWFIDAGVAIDPLGREIVVAESLPFNPAQPTDDQGRPAGAPLATGTVEICLQYQEIATDLVPVLVADCDGEGDCAPSTIREGFLVLVRAAPPAAPAPTCTLPGFPVPAGKGLHDALVDRLRTSCAASLGDSCVPIARIDLATNAVDVVTSRPLIYSNERLFEMIVCLADHLAGAASRILRYVSGDGQSAPAGGTLVDPLVVELVDQQNNPVSGETIEFHVRSGTGTVSSASVVTAADGRATTTWTLGAAPGEQQASATAKGSAFDVTFRATAV